MSIFHKLLNLDRRWLFAILIVVMVFVQIKPVGLAITISETTRKAFDVIDALPEGSKVLVSFDYPAASESEVESTLRSIIAQSFDNNLKVYIIALWDQGGIRAVSLLEELLSQYPNKEYGKDYINIGFRPGGQVLLQQMSEDFPGAVLNIDQYGESLSKFSMMTGIETIKDFDIIVEGSGGDPGVKDYIRVVTDAYDIPFVAAVVSVSATEFMPYYNSGQLSGMVISQRGAAEYEVISGHPGRATSAMDVQSFIHLTMLIFILIGNIAYFVTRRSTN